MISIAALEQSTGSSSASAPAVKPTPTCKAWMGLHPEDATIARICQYCPDRDIAERAAEEAGLEMSHGSCDECHREEMAKIRAMFERGELRSVGATEAAQ